MSSNFGFLVTPTRFWRFNFGLFSLGGDFFVVLTDLVDGPRNETRLKCQQVAVAKNKTELSSEACGTWNQFKCVQINKTTQDVIQTFQPLRWFCADCDEKVRGLLSTIPQFADKREAEGKDFPQKKFGAVTKSGHSITRLGVKKGGFN